MTNLQGQIDQLKDEMKTQETAIAEVSQSVEEIHQVGDIKWTARDLETESKGEWALMDGRILSPSACPALFAQYKYGPCPTMASLIRKLSDYNFDFNYPILETTSYYIASCSNSVYPAYISKSSLSATVATSGPNRSMSRTSSIPLATPYGLYYLYYASYVNSSNPGYFSIASFPSNVGPNGGSTIYTDSASGNTWAYVTYGYTSTTMYILMEREGSWYIYRFPHGMSQVAISPAIGKQPSIPIFLPSIEKFVVYYSATGRYIIDPLSGSLTSNASKSITQEQYNMLCNALSSSYRLHASPFITDRAVLFGCASSLTETYSLPKFLEYDTETQNARTIIMESVRPDNLVYQWGSQTIPARVPYGYMADGKTVWAMLLSSYYTFTNGVALCAPTFFAESPTGVLRYSRLNTYQPEYTSPALTLTVSRGTSRTVNVVAYDTFNSTRYLHSYSSNAYIRLENIQRTLGYATQSPYMKVR